MCSCNVSILGRPQPTKQDLKDVSDVQLTLMMISTDVTAPQPEANAHLATELVALRKLDCWTCIPRSAATNKVLNCGFVYKDKPATPPLPAQAKARLCIKGYNKDVRYLETFAPVVRFETVRAALL